MQARGEQAFLRLAEQILAPVVDQRQLPQVATRTERPGDGFAPGIGIPGNLVVQCLGEAGFRHGCVTRHEQLELLPARRSSLALATEQAQACRAEQQAGMLGGDHDRIVFCRRLRHEYGRTADR